jgi:hypothetical protein
MAERALVRGRRLFGSHASKDFARLGFSQVAYDNLVYDHERAANGALRLQTAKLIAIGAKTTPTMVDRRS